MSIGLTDARRDAHQHLAAGGLGVGQLADADVLGRAGLLDVGGAHGRAAP